MYMKRIRRFSVSEARKQFASIIRDAERGAVIELTRRGRPVAVMVSPADYGALQGRAGGFWDEIRVFREGFDLDELDIEAVYRIERPRSAGRRVDL